MARVVSDHPVAVHAFPETRWTRVCAAGGHDRSSAEALADLCERYWPPVYAYVRRRGCPAERAEDLTQGFFARLIEKNYVGQADRRRGRFRTFLLSSFRHYMANEWDRAHAQKRGGSLAILSLDFEQTVRRRRFEPVDGETPESCYLREWARTLLDRVLEDLRVEMERSGRGEKFERLRPLLTPSEGEVPYRQIAADLGMTEGSVKVALHRMRRRFARLLRAAVADTVERDQDIADELRFLIGALGGGPRP